MDHKSEDMSQGESLTVVNSQSDNVNNQLDNVNNPSDNVNNQSDDVNIQSDNVNNQSDNVNNQSDNVNNQSDNVNNQSDDVNIQSDDVNNQSDNVNNQSDNVNNQSDNVNNPSDNVNNQSDNVNIQSDNVNIQSNDVNYQLDSGSLDEQQSAMKDEKNKIDLSQDEQLDLQTLPDSPNTSDISPKESFSKESVGGEVKDIEMNSGDTDSVTENQPDDGGGDNNVNNGVSHFINVENIGTMNTQTESTELSIPKENNERSNSNDPDNKTELENQKEICDEIATDIKIANVSAIDENVDSDFSDESEKSEDISQKDDSRVNESSESVIEKESPTFDEVRDDEEDKSDVAKKTVNVEDATVNEMSEAKVVNEEKAPNAEISSRESTQNEDSTLASTEEKAEPVEEWMDILGNGLLKKKVVKAGEGRPSRPKAGELVSLNADGRLDNGTVVDNFESVSFILGDGDVLQAWDLAVALMEMGEICELITDSKYAYGSLGKEEIPGNATITYTLELIKKEPGFDLESMSIEERTKKGEAKRERGNHLFSRKEFQSAINSYTKALQILEYPASTYRVEPEILKNLSNSRMKCYNNLAACQLKIEAYDAAIKSSNKVLSNEPDNVKALFRIGKSFSCKGDCEHAEPYLRKALSLDPQSKMLHRELAWVTRRIKQDSASQKEMYRRMLGVDKNAPKKKQNKWWRMPLVLGSIVAGTLAVVGALYRSSQH